MTAGAGHTAGHTEDRRGASRAHTQKTGRNKPRGRGHSRRHTATTEHTEGRSRSGGQAEGRQEGRNTDGLAPGGAVETRGARQQAGSRERRKEEYVIYLRERGEKNTAETRKSIQACAYTYHLTSWRVGCLLRFLLYIIRGYIIYIYIYYITPINVYFSFKVNVYRYSYYYIR